MNVLYYFSYGACRSFATKNAIFKGIVLNKKWLQYAAILILMWCYYFCYFKF